MMPHKGTSMQCHNQQVLAKPCHNPSNRDQQVREKLQQKAKIEPAPIIVKHPAVHQNKSPPQQPSNGDTIERSHNLDRSFRIFI